MSQRELLLRLLNRLTEKLTDAQLVSVLHYAYYTKRVKKQEEQMIV